MTTGPRGRSRAEAAQGLDVVVLAGGRSRRLGRDKVQVEVGGQRQLDRVVAALAGLGGRVVLAAGDDPARSALATGGVEVVVDQPGLAGPLGGIVAGLRAAGSSRVAVVAVDLVAPSVALLHALADLVERDGLAGAVPMVAGRWQPLHSVLRGDLAARLVQSVPGAPAGRGQRGRSVRSALQAVGVVGIPERRWRPWAPDARPELDIDTPEDLRRARGGHGRSPGR